MAETEATVAGTEAEDWAAWERSAHGDQRDLVAFAHWCPLAGSARALWPLGHGSQPFLPVAEAGIVGPAFG